MLKQSLNHKMLQKLSPQQIQLMKLLQIPTATLDNRIKEELESNPALDEGEEEQDVFDIEKRTEAEEESGPESESFELDDYLNDYIDEDPVSYKLMADNFSSTEEDKTIPISVQQSFHEYLDNQLNMLGLESEKEILIGKQIIGSIDHDGYLRRIPKAIIDDLMFTQNMDASEEEIQGVLRMVQNFDPSGIGASNLQECLLIQIERRLELEDGADKKVKKLAFKILKNHFNEFTKKHYEKLQKHLFVSESELRDAITEILKLNPKPASGFRESSSGAVQYIVPDFFVSNRDGELDITLNSKNAPDLRVNENYREMLISYKQSNVGKKKSKQEKEAVMFIKQKIDSAKWFIDAIKQRQETLYKTMYSIMQYQYEYFISGDERRLKPMILKDIAEITALDISTVSRVANSKFVQTEFGTKRLKDFFSESLQTKDGTEVSTLEVKNILSDIISSESKRKPLSDEKLKDFLQKKGYNIARRTVAKYREQLSIPVARLRKVL